MMGRRAAAPRHLAALLAFSLAGCRTGPPPDDAAGVEVAAALASYLSALTTKPVNVDTLAAYYDPNAEIYEPGVVPLNGLERVRFFLDSYRDVTVQSAEFKVDTVEVHGAVAYLWGFWSQMLRGSDSTIATRGRAVWVWTKDPATGRWRIRRTLTQPVGG